MRPASRKVAKGTAARAEAAKLYAEGVSVSEIARRLEVRRETVSRWVNHRAVEEVAVEKVKRAATFEDAATAARAELREGLHAASLKLVGLTKDPDPNVALRAVGMLMDRAGLPRAEVVISHGPPLDLSGLTDEELDLFERVMLKASASSSSSPSPTATPATPER